jgi:hypothetical protein
MQLTFDYGRILDFVRKTLDLPEAAEFENRDEHEYLKKLL